MKGRHSILGCQGQELANPRSEVQPFEFTVLEMALSSWERRLSGLRGLGFGGNGSNDACSKSAGSGDSKNTVISNSGNKMEDPQSQEEQ